MSVALELLIPIVDVVLDCMVAEHERKGGLFHIWSYKVSRMQEVRREKDGSILCYAIARCSKCATAPPRDRHTRF